MKNKDIYSILLKKLKNATLGKTSASEGKSTKTPWSVAKPPIIQKNIIGIVNGVFNVAFLSKSKIIQTRIMSVTAKSSARIYTHVFFISIIGILG